MAEIVRNRLAPAALTDTDVEAALACLEVRDGDRANEARHVFETLTSGRALTPAGETTVVAMLRVTAAGPGKQLW